MISRVSSFAHTSAMTAASLKVQAKLAEQQDQTASGLKSQTYGGMARSTASILTLGNQSARLTADNTAATSAASFVQAAYSAVGSIADLATTIKTQLASMMSSSTLDAGATSQYAADWLTDLQALLNSQQGGTYLFSGQATDTAPVDFSAAGYDPTAGADTSYYGGATTGRTYSSSEGQTVGLSVSANASAFEQLARAIATVAADPSDPDAIASAYALSGTALTGVGTLQETIAIQASSLQSATDRNTAKIDAIDTLVTSMKGADLTQAAVLTTQYQTQLEALFSMINTLSSLSLSKYL
ncbi:flagellin [Caulobacter soli]|uniref:flagellin n=1 Tax=Caulobacter soli TaxID=2708539 RepID=UPI0013EBF52F|nr:flagellin [Caulobacter soli]